MASRCKSASRRFNNKLRSTTIFSIRRWHPFMRTHLMKFPASSGEKSNKILGGIHAAAQDLGGGSQGGATQGKYKDTRLDEPLAKLETLRHASNSVLASMSAAEGYKKVGWMRNGRESCGTRVSASGAKAYEHHTPSRIISRARKFQASREGDQNGIFGNHGFLSELRERPVVDPAGLRTCTPRQQSHRWSGEHPFECCTGRTCKNEAERMSQCRRIGRRSFSEHAGSCEERSFFSVAVVHILSECASPQASRLEFRRSTPAHNALGWEPNYFRARFLRMTGPWASHTSHGLFGLRRSPPANRNDRDPCVVDTGQWSRSSHIIDIDQWRYRPVAASSPSRKRCTVGALRVGWSRRMCVERAASFSAPGILKTKPTALRNGLRQGCPTSPVVLTIVVELTLCELVGEWKHEGHGWECDGDFVPLLA